MNLGLILIITAIILAFIQALGVNTTRVHLGWLAFALYVLATAGFVG